jgi:hypothetical protein
VDVPQPGSGAGWCSSAERHKSGKYGCTNPVLRKKGIRLMFRDVNHWNRCLVAGIAVLLAGCSASGILTSRLEAQSAAATSPSPSPAPPNSSVRYRPNQVPKREREYLGMIWGVDQLSVKAVESGELIRFSYHVVNPSKAKPLNDKKIDAFLISPVAQVKLVIPSLEKVGQLRQTETPEAGKSYWMAFSNPRRKVKPGDHVNVDIGQFHVAGLLVE